MSSADTTVDRIDFSHLQGLVPRLYKYPLSRYLLFRFVARGEEPEPSAARALLTELIPRVTTAADDLSAKPEPLLNIGLTAGGLGAMGLRPEVLQQFEPVFLGGPEGTDASIALGDFGPSAPERWWGERFRTADVHGLLQVTARTDAGLDEGTGSLRDALGRLGCEELIPGPGDQPLEGRSLGGGRLHFGYTDGISHPDVRWGDATDVPGTIDFRHYLLGYAREPLLSSPTGGPAAELARGSSYAVFRVLAQDVPGFERFLDERAPRVAHLTALGVDPRELLAAKMLGRWRDGTPLVLSPEQPDAAQNRRDDFVYGDDADGLRCPFSAHIRVVNPRDQRLDARIEGPPPISFGPVPTVLRRGLPYGPEWVPGVNDESDRGLIGLFLCASIRLQIYTLTRWMKKNDFSPVFRGRTRAQDALFANRGVPGAATDFEVPADGGPVSIPALPDFVRTRGTVFLLVPSLPTLRALARSL